MWKKNIFINNLAFLPWKKKSIIAVIIQIFSFIDIFYPPAYVWIKRLDQLILKKGHFSYLVLKIERCQK